MIQIKYFPGTSFLHRLDPRVKFLLVTLFIFAEVAFLDIRILIFPFAASILLYLSIRVPFKEVKGTWKFLLTIIVFITSINALFTFLGYNVLHPHIIASFWVFKITTEGIVLMAASLMRFLSLATVSMCVVNTTDPGLYRRRLQNSKSHTKGPS